MNIAPIFRLVKKKPVASGGAEVRSIHPDRKIVGFWQSRNQELSSGQKDCRFLAEQKSGAFIRTKKLSVSGGAEKTNSFRRSTDHPRRKLSL
jgi:hypothetical protein